MPDSSGTPTPRDRAVAVVALGIEEQISEFVHQRVDENGGGFEADATEAARAAVDALLASPDILRELAGQQEPLHEITCPSCSTTIRARMADTPASTTLRDADDPPPGPWHKWAWEVFGA